MSKDDWPIADQWAALGMHWHGYVERVALAHAATREERLTGEPDEVMVNPDEVAAWLEGTIKAATAPAPIKGGKSANSASIKASKVDDLRDFADSMTVWRSLASRGESVSTGVNGQITVTADAVTERECDCQITGSASVSRLNKGRRR
ncbi:MAG TPA: hypothetical protein VHW44_23710 [Pseudonocardiaceae bacterium]|jgi:hypothetical protein|nr:hypothetical protein [Pseudonocardiaceae bacterium]